MNGTGAKCVSANINSKLSGASKLTLSSLSLSYTHTNSIYVCMYIYLCVCVCVLYIYYMHTHTHTHTCISEKSRGDQRHLQSKPDTLA